MRLRPQRVLTLHARRANSSRNSVLKTATHRQTNDSKNAVVFCRLAHLPVARSFFGLGSTTDRQGADLFRSYRVLPLAKTAEGIELRGRDSSRHKISSSKLLRTDKIDSKNAVVFCRLAHLPVARSNLTLGSSPMICGGFYAEASPRRRLKTTEGIDRFSSALALRRGTFSLFISVSTLFLHQYYVKFFIFSFKISVIFVKLLRHIFSILQYFFAMHK